MGRLLREDTAYSSGFSDAAFRTFAPGQPDVDLRRRLGPPRDESWYYFDGHAMEMSAASAFTGCQAVHFENGVVTETIRADACRARGVLPGSSFDAVAQRLGPAPEACLDYSWSPTKAHFRQRTICVALGKVTLVAGRWQ
jgi:hypothetical protein